MIFTDRIAAIFGGANIPAKTKNELAVKQALNTAGHYTVHISVDDPESETLTGTMEEAFSDVVAAHKAGRIIDTEVSLGDFKVYGTLSARNSIEGEPNILVLSSVVDMSSPGEPNEHTLFQVSISETDVDIKHVTATVSQ